MITSCRRFGSPTPSASPMAGSAGSMMSIDAAFTAIMAAINATN